MPDDILPETEEIIEDEIEDEDEAELIAMAARIDALEAKNLELENEIVRAHERCRVLEESRLATDSIPLPHFWGRKIGE